MTGREFMAVVAGVAAWPFAVRAAQQQAAGVTNWWRAPPAMRSGRFTNGVSMLRLADAPWNQCR